jgi:hypothetical protein
MVFYFIFFYKRSVQKKIITVLMGFFSTEKPKRRFCVDNTSASYLEDVMLKARPRY